MSLFSYSPLLADSAAAGIIGVVVALALAGLLIFLCVKLVNHFAAKRALALQQSFGALGLAAAPEEIGFLNGILQQFSLGRRGHGRRLINPFRSPETNGESYYVMDYHFTEGHGKGARHWALTPLLAHRSSLALPAFTLAPEGIFSKIGQLLGGQDYDFPTHPVFSKKYQLKGSNEAAIREVFTPTILSALEQMPGWTVEAQGPYLLIYKFNVRVKPAEAAAFLQERQAVARLFLQK